MYIALRQEQTAPRAQTFNVNRNVLSLHSCLVSLKKMSLKSGFIQFFHNLIHVYSPGAGGIQPPGDKIFMSTERPYQFVASFKEISLKSDFIQFLHVYSPGAGGKQPLGDKVLM